MENIIYVTAFGGFSMRFGDNTISDQDNRSKKIWTIIEYIITFHSKSITRASLIDLLWTEDSISDSPENALKTCLHRARTMLAKLKCPEDLILQKRGTFSWNSRISIIADFEEFERLCGLASDKSRDIQERLCYYSSALSLYKGDFLPKCSGDDWAAPIVTYYHTLYLKTVHSYMELLLDNMMYQEMIDCCCYAIIIDSYDELLHYYLILALYRSGKHEAALERYDKVISMYYDNFGINPPKKLTDLRKEISHKEHETETSLSEIIDDLHETKAQKGAFKCDYSVFQAIYRISARAVARSGQSIYLCLVSLKIPSTADNAVRLLSDAMERMGNIIFASLRTGDVYSRYSKNQYLIMLPTAYYESSLAIGERILKNYESSKPHIRVKASYQVKHLEPQMFYQEDG